MFSQASVILFKGVGYAWSQVPSRGWEYQMEYVQGWVHQEECIPGVGIPKGAVGIHLRVWDLGYLPPDTDT